MKLASVLQIFRGNRVQGIEHFDHKGSRRSGIAASHPVAQYGLPTDWDYWEPIDRKYLEMCDEVVVLTLPSWQESRGVQAEIRLAREMGKPVEYLNFSGRLMVIRAVCSSN